MAKFFKFISEQFYFPIHIPYSKKASKILHTAHLFLQNKEKVKNVFTKKSGLCVWQKHLLIERAICLFVCVFVRTSFHSSSSFFLPQQPLHLNANSSIPPPWTSLCGGEGNEEEAFIFPQERGGCCLLISLLLHRRLLLK